MIKQPSSRNCFVCGVENDHGLHLEFYENDAGEVIVDYVIADRFQGYPGIAHGGIVASLVDEVLGRVHMGGDNKSPRFMYTAKLTINYRKPVPLNTPVRIIGKRKRSKGRVASSTAEIIGPSNTVLVEAEALLVEVPKEQLDDVNLEELGWKVYDATES